MKKSIIIAISVLAATVSYGGPACCPSAAGSSTKPAGASTEKASNAAPSCSIDELSKCFNEKKKLSSEDLKSLLEAKADIVLVDARTPKWDDGARIANAKNLTPESTDAEINAELTDKNAYIVTYCGSAKCPLSHQMATRLKTMGYNNVLVYPAGIDGWSAAGKAL